MSVVTAPLFILAPPRSFTSVVCGMLGQHPQLLGLPEVNLLAAEDVAGLQRIHRMRPRFGHGLLRAIAELGLGEQSVGNIDAAQKWLDEQPEQSTGAIFRDLIEWSAPRRPVDKSPMYVYGDETLPRMDRFFPDAHYLHLVRHPRGTCESIHALRQQYGDSMLSRQPLDPDTAWLKPHLRVMEFVETLPSSRWLRIRGEDLLADPPLYLPQIAQWLGIDSGPEAIDAMMHPERSPFACPGPTNARFGNDPSFLEAPRLRPYAPKPLSLSGPLAWDSNLHFGETLKHYAQFFGYA